MKNSWETVKINQCLSFLTQISQNLPSHATSLQMWDWYILLGYAASTFPLL